MLPPGLPVQQVIQASTMDGSQYLSSIENQAQLEEIPIAQDEQNVYEEAYISQYMDAVGAKKEEAQTTVAPIHTVVETPQELAAGLTEQEKEIQPYVTYEGFKHRKEEIRNTTTYLMISTPLRQYT
uniref:Uncharacterized protein n=1 Tax=Romanomermis culicivorax TaxID=13658 RepID=A0A915IR59_ROMCU